MNQYINLFYDSGWEDALEYSKGSKKKVLRDQNGAKTILLYLPENFHMDAHTHITTEQHFVLRGEYTIEDKVYPEGTYQIFQPHESHGPFDSKKGALILVVWDPYPVVEKE